MLSLGNATDLCNFRCLRRVQRGIEIPILLQIEPKPRRCAERLLQTQRSVWRDAALAVDNLVEPYVRNANRIGKLCLRDAQWLKKLLLQHLPGVRRGPMSR